MAQKVPRMCKTTFDIIGGEDGGERHIVLGENEEAVSQIEQKMCARALSQGKTIRKPDGTAVWRETEPITKRGVSGSTAYFWDKTGNKVRAERVEYIKDVAGKVT